MSRVATLIVVVLVMAWVVAHVLYLGPVRDATEVTLTWTITILVASALLASFALLTVGLVLGRTSPAWLRFVQAARTGAAIAGSALVVIGLIHYRDTEPSGDVGWIVVGVIVLAAAGLVHVWVVRAKHSVLD